MGSRAGGMTQDDGRGREQEPGRGRSAESPTEVPRRGWKDILWRTWSEINDDRVTLVAAGATYFLLLSLVPTLTAFVSLYGLFTDPATVNEHVGLLSAVLPAGGMQIVDEQLTRLTEQGTATLGWGLAVSIGIALWSASSGVKTMFEAMNIAYDEREKRNFIMLNALALGFTLAGILAAVVMVGVVVLMPAILAAQRLDEAFGWLLQAVGYLLVAVMLFIGIAGLYRFGPSRQQAKWRWLTPGAIVAIVVILIASLAFSWYSANFANYEQTYGSLGALIGFLTWVWISVTVVIVGAELNAEAEHQTARDTTIGDDHPIGSRNAVMADTIGRSTSEGGDHADDAARGPEWQAGYAAAREKYRPRRPLSPGSLAFAVPTALALHWIGRRKRTGD